MDNFSNATNFVNFTHNVCCFSCCSNQSNDNWIAWGTFIATVALAIGTWVMAIVMYRGNQQTNQNTRNSNIRAEIEFKVRMKPIFVLEDIRVFWLDLDPNVKNQMGFHCLIKNEGMLSARKVNVRVLQTNNTKIEDVIREFSPNIGGIPVGTIPRNHGEPFNNLKTFLGKGTHLALWFDYVYFDGIQDQVIALVPLIITDHNVKPIPIWYEYEDIKDAQKWNEDGLSGKRSAPT